MQEEIPVVNPSLIVVLLGILVSVACFKGAQALNKRLPAYSPSSLRSGLVIFSAGFIAVHLLGMLILDVEEDSLITRLIQSVLIQGGVCIASLMVIALYSGRKGIRETGFTLQKPIIVLTFTVLAYFAYFPLYTFACWINDLVVGYEPQKLVREILDNPDLLHSLPVLLSAMLLVPLIEEILFRGFLQSGLREYLSPRLSVLLTAILFGLMHDLQAVIPIFALGCLLGYLRERTGSLYASMLVHVMHNSFMLLVLPFL